VEIPRPVSSRQLRGCSVGVTITPRTRVSGELSSQACGGVPPAFRLPLPPIVHERWLLDQAHSSSLQGLVRCTCGAKAGLVLAARRPVSWHNLSQECVHACGRREDDAAINRDRELAVEAQLPVVGYFRNAIRAVILHCGHPRW